MSEWKFEVTQLKVGSCSCGTAKKIIIGNKAETQINSLIRVAGDREWIAGIKGNETGDYFYVEELVLKEQEVTSTTCEYTDNGAVELAKEKLIGWMHSHANMSPFQSSCDIDTSSRHKVNITVNNKKEYYATVMTEHKCGDVTLMVTEVLREGDVSVDLAFQELAKTLIKAKEYKYEDGGFLSLGYAGEQTNFISGKICGSCNNKLSRNTKKVANCEDCSISCHPVCLDSHGLCVECVNEAK